MPRKLLLNAGQPFDKLPGDFIEQGIMRGKAAPPRGCGARAVKLAVEYVGFGWKHSFG